MEIQNNLSHAGEIIFFDGICGLCNGFVDFVIAQDKEHVFRFSPLQSEFASRTLPPQIREDIQNGKLDSICVYKNGQILQKSDAVLSVLGELPGIFSLLKFCRFIPRGLRDFVYDFVAKNRYKFFGKKDSCRLPSAEERKLFLL